MADKKKVTTDILAAASIAAAVLHAQGVTLGHFGSGDFLDIIGKISAELYATAAAPTPAPSSTK